MKKKLASLICGILVLCLTYSSVCAEKTADEENAAEQNILSEMSDERFEVYSEAKMLLDKIAGENLFSTEAQSVTRLEFVTALVKVLKSPYVDNADFSFEDAPRTDEAYAAVYTALSNGWISKSEKFNAENSIKFDDALKMIVSAMGYNAAAQSFGGYPGGYVRVAGSLGLCDDVESGETLDYADATIILFNLLKCDWTILADYGENSDNKIKYVKTDDNYLSALYSIYETEGTINATTYNSLMFNTAIVERKFVEIDGVSYDYGDVTPELLANYCRAYYRKVRGQKEIVALKIKGESFRLELDDYLDYKENRVTYENESGKEKSLKLKNSSYMIFNGRLVNGFDKSKFDGDGYALFIDGDEDGIFDAVQIYSYTYAVVSGVDKYNGIIGDKNNSDYSIDIKKISQDGSVWIKKSDGGKMSQYDINDGDVLLVLKSDDMNLLEITVIDDYISGKVEEITAAGEYVINGETYKSSAYFEKNYKNSLKLGESGRFALGYGGMLVSASKYESGYKYGYLINSFKDEKDPNAVKIKLFSQEGKITNLITAKRVTIDGSVKKTVSEILDAINIGGEERHDAVKYYLDSEGKISKLDFAEDYDELLGDAQTSNPDNCFVYYKNFTGESLVYRSPNTTFNSFFNVSGAVCMSIPSDMDAAERYFRKGAPSEIFSNNSTYSNIYAYDIDEYGNAAFVIEKYDRVGEIKAGGKDNVYVVCSTYKCINEDGDEAVGITAWRNGKFYSFAFSGDLEFTRDISPSVKTGDVVRLKADDKNTVYSLAVDFNVTAFDKNSTLSSNSYQNKNTSYSCWFGMPYSVSGNYMQLMTEKDIDGNYITSKNNLKNFSVNTANIVRVDLKSNEVRPVTKTEIKTYKAFGLDAEYIWLVQDCDAPVLLVLFDNYGA